ncbi:MAG: gamma-butyrobetaine hydroxylase-like domain-containing protein [Vulcanimicrobiota bacterium]
MALQPVKVETDNDKGILTISWSDGTASRHSMDQLRRDCPCATCRAEREKMAKPGPSLRVISGPVLSEGQARILEFSPVGRYALAFVWNDGHSTGIYTYDSLLDHQL